MICGTVCTTVPAAAADTDTAVSEEASETAEYDFSGPKKTVKEDSVEFAVFDGYAAVGKVYDEDIEEFTVPEMTGELPVVGIAPSAFGKCSKLKKITLSKNVCVFDWDSFAEEGIEEIAVSEDNGYFTVSDGVLYTKDMKELVCCPTAGGKTEITIPDTVERIGTGAFVCCRDLKKVVMGDNVKSVGPIAFWGCSGLSEISLPEGITIIEHGTFSGCTSLTDFDIPDSTERVDAGAFQDAGCVEAEDKILYVDNWAVGSEQDIVNADIREGTVGTALGLFVIYPRKYLETITVPASVKHLDSYLYLAINGSLRTVKFYNDTIPIKCLMTNNVREVYIYDPFCKIADDSSDFTPYWKEADISNFSGNEDKPVEYKLGSSAVQSSNSTANSVGVSVSVSITEIESPPETEEQEKARIEKAVAEYRERQEQQKVYNAPVKINGTPRYDTVIYGYSDSTAEYYAAKYKRCFEALPDEDIGAKYTEISGGGLKYRIYGEDHAEAQLFETSLLKTDVYIPEEINGIPVTKFYDGTDYGNFGKYRIHLPKTVKSIGAGKYTKADNIMSYDISSDNPYLCSSDGIVYTKDMTTLVRIPSYYNASKEVVIPDGVKIIGRGACFGLNNIQKITLPDSLEIIGEDSFRLSCKLSSMELPEGLLIIGPTAFADCIALEDINIPDSVEQIGYKAFDWTEAIEYENGCAYLGNWLVQTDSFTNRPVIKEGTEGIATVDLFFDAVIPASVTKMSWELTNSWANGIGRADVYSHIIEKDAFKNAAYMSDIYIYDPECEISEGENTIPAKYTEMPDLSGFNTNMPTRHDSGFTRTPAAKKADSGDKEYDVVIHGFEGSTAEAYAKLYGRKFEAIDESGSYRDGDINGDAGFNVADLVLVNRYMHGTYTFTEQQFRSADLNGDGNVDVFDIVEYRKKLIE